MATTTKVAKNVYRINSDYGPVIRYLVRVKVTPTDERIANFQTYEEAVAKRDELIKEREGLRKAASIPVSKSRFKQWGYL